MTAYSSPTSEGTPDRDRPATEPISRRYVAVMLGVLGTLMGFVLAFNLMLGERALGSPETVKAASDWQESTRGVTYPPPITVNRPFKILRLHDRLPEVNGVVFGASSSMGLTADA